MKTWTAAFAAAWMVVPTSSAFQTAPISSQRKASQLYSDPQAFTEYMVKAHEDKLKAVKQVEEKKNVEIESLKKELKALKSAPGALATYSTSPLPVGLDVSSMTKEQLAQKLLSYQQFMAKYIVDAQMQKTKAVVAAENAIKQKYEEKVKLLTGSTSIAETTIVTTATVESSPAFQQRSAKVSAAAAAGKSRWGDLENEKASHVVGTINGSVRVKEIPTPTTLALAPPMAGASSFNQRNAMVAAAGRAGKSRWGEMEVERATQAATLLSGSSTPLSVPPTFTTVPPEVEAADHGLRADGGVGGPSLAERVNFGAQLLQGSVASLVPDLLGSTLAPASSASSSYYGKRNSMIVAAGLAGKSRWGEMEIIKAKRLIASLPATSTDASVKVTQEIEAADHGLRADGGVGGPSLAQRVNFGAALLGQ